MKTFVDASVLVAAAVEGHPHHAQAKEWLEAAVGDGDRLFVSDHALAEMYAGLSGAQFDGRMLRTRQVQRIIEDYLGAFEMVIETTLGDYRKAIDAAVRKNLRGGIVYDAIHVRAAKRERIKRLVTLNGKHYRKLWDKTLVEL